MIMMRERKKIVNVRFLENKRKKQIKICQMNRNEIPGQQQQQNKNTKHTNENSTRSCLVPNLLMIHSFIHSFSNKNNEKKSTNFDADNEL